MTIVLICLAAIGLSRPARAAEPVAESVAAARTHWSLVAPQAARLPTVSQAAWPRHPLDYFILARLDHEGLTPSPPAARSEWLRRVSLDLTGLPPTLDMVDEFLADEAPDTFSRVVDRLLASPRYGERMAIDWLDSARYADTHGMFSDLERPLWRWREWVIAAFNRGQAFDEFSIEQLAGDLLPNATLEQKIATGLHRNHTVTDETGIIDEEYRVEYVADRLETTATIWLGLTLGCARCHDHKFDPFSQREYFQLFAFFNNGPDTGLAPREPPPVLSVPTPEYDAELTRRRARRQAREAAWQPQAEPLSQAQTAWERTALAELPLASQTGLLAELTFDPTPPRANEPDPEPLPARADFALEALQREGAPPVTLVDGILGKCLQFDTPYFAELGTQPTLESDEPWSISLWANVEKASLACVLSKQAADARGIEIQWTKGRLKVVLQHRRDENAIQVSTRSAAATAGQWNHIAITYDGSRHARGVQVDVNGVPQELRVDRDTLSASIATDTAWKLGRNDAGLGFTGKIDQLRIYRRVLEQREIVEALFHGEELTGILSLEPIQRTASQRSRLQNYYLTEIASPAARASWRDLNLARQAETDWVAAIPKTLVMEDRPQRRTTHVLQNGQYDQPGEVVEPSVPAVFPQLAISTPGTRLDLARWLMRPKNPLPARVLVNRYWTLLFGHGFVKTANDFGTQGERPSHAELLDWLAVDFREHAWDLKRMLRGVTLSATYQQSSYATRATSARDPENRLLARGPRFRLGGEAIRDQALASAGLLVHRLGGPSVKPYQPAGLWEAVSYDGNLTYVEDHGESLYRRTLYSYWKRQAPPPMLLSFDSPTRETCVVQRARTNTPLQALVLWNDPTFVEAARHLATSVLHEASTRDERIELAYRRVLARLPRDNERQTMADFVQHQEAEYATDAAKAKRLLAVGASPADEAFSASELAAWTTFASVLLCLDETITKP